MVIQYFSHGIWPFHSDYLQLASSSLATEYAVYLVHDDCWLIYPIMKKALWVIQLIHSSQSLILWHWRASKLYLILRILLELEAVSELFYKQSGSTGRIVPKMWITLINIDTQLLQNFNSSWQLHYIFQKTQLQLSHTSITVVSI